MLVREDFSGLGCSSEHVCSSGFNPQHQHQKDFLEKVTLGYQSEYIEVWATHCMVVS